MKIEDLTLPKSGGVVRFRDDDDLTGRHLRQFRAYTFGFVSSSIGDSRNRAVGYAAALLIASWEVPGFPNLPLPTITPDGDLAPGGLNFIPWRDLAAIDDAVMLFVNEIIFDLVPASDPKEPSETLTESAPLSA